MEFLITYDVSTETKEGRRRLRKVAEACVGHGQRVQQSVFECSLTIMQWEALRHQLLLIIDEAEDSLRVYRLREPHGSHVEVYGLRPAIDFHAPLIL